MDTSKEKLNEEIKFLRKRIAQLEQSVAERRTDGQAQVPKISLCNLTQYANDLIILLDDSFRFLETSEGVINFYGYTREELVGMHATELRAPETKPLFDEQIKPVYLKDMVVYETVHQRKDGTRFPVEISLRAINLEGKRFYYAIVRNITERHKAEQALYQSEERYRGIVDNIGIGVALISPEMEVLSLNKQMKKWNPRIDLKDKHICYRSFNNPPGDKICSYCPTALTLKDGLVHEAVTETPMSGQVFNYRVVSSPIKDKAGKIIAAIEMVEDITDRRKIEEYLQLTQFIVDREADAVFLIGKDTKFAYVNETACKRTGYSREELLRLGVFDIDPVFPRASWDEHWEEVKQRKNFIIQTQHRTKAGQLYPVEISLNYVKYRDKEYDCAIARDITLRKQAEQALISKTALLEAQVNSTIDGLLVVDENQKRVLTNRRIVELFDVPQDILDNSDDTLLLKYVVGLTKYPEKFLEKVTYLYDHSSEISRDEIEFKSGMVLDRYSAPVLGSDGKSYGRIWIFRDITERKKLEEERRNRLKELEVFYKAAMGREERIIELKKEVEELKKKLK